MVKKIKSQKNKNRGKWNYSKGGASLSAVVAMGLALFAAYYITGFSRPAENTRSENSTSQVNMCCDSGEGEACKPQTGGGQKIVYNNQEYGLVSSGMRFIEGNLHLRDSGQTSGGSPIILNSTENYFAEDEDIKNLCNRPNPQSEPKDLYFKKNPGDPYILMKTEGDVQRQHLKELCDSVPNDQIVFVCKKNCMKNACSGEGIPEKYAKHLQSCYGNEDSVYDVYFRLSDYPVPGIPNFVKYCDKSNLSKSTNENEAPEQKIVYDTKDYAQKESLQLRTFWIVEYKKTKSQSWLSPLCKPAIYLYPQEKTRVNVKVATKGEILLSIPTYIPEGWTVEAEPNGMLDFRGTNYDYLYYEASVGDKFIPKDDEGYVIRMSDLSNFFSEVLPKLGLNEKERKDFSDYWLKALPQSPFYKIAIIKSEDYETVSKLEISPKAENIIRVILYFIPVEKMSTMKQPQIVTPSREGFTVVEWGGLFKKDKNHQFTCLM